MFLMIYYITGNVFADIIYTHKHHMRYTHTPFAYLVINCNKQICVCYKTICHISKQHIEAHIAPLWNECLRIEICATHWKSGSQFAGRCPRKSAIIKAVVTQHFSTSFPLFLIIFSVFRFENCQVLMLE